MTISSFIRFSLLLENFLLWLTLFLKEETEFCFFGCFLYFEPTFFPVFTLSLSHLLLVKKMTLSIDS